MSSKDVCVTVVPYFKIPPGKMETVREMCSQFMQMTQTEPKCLYYGFSFDGDLMHCREGYDDADGLLAHLASVGPLMGELMRFAPLTRIEVHGPEEEIEKLRAPLADLKPQYFTLEYGFRR